tara:strand:+ start:2156 stop:2737 length:582 start_codon:yes stop_codon:yes gene_type:complete
MSVLQYHYDFELSSKQKTFLWLYQVLPNLDMIHKIYKLKEEMEHAENLMDYGLCPSNVKIVGTWIPATSNGGWEIVDSRDIMKINALCMKLIVCNGLICGFTMPRELTHPDRELMIHGLWEFIVPECDYDPPLRDKIECMNKILDEAPYFLPDICKKLNRIYHLYLNREEVPNDYVRIGLDNRRNWHIPAIYF